MLRASAGRRDRPDKEATMPNDEQSEAAGTPRSGPSGDPLAPPDAPGAYGGNRPERQAETSPAGGRDDGERIAAHSTQREPVVDDSDDPPDLREAGENH